MAPIESASRRLDRARDADTPSIARTIALAFGGTPEGAQDWIKLGGLDNLRVLREGAGVPACLLRIPMGQYFGGRSVPMVGIAGVGVAPESRGRGLARELMAQTVREIASGGVALSCLYASTQALYRQSGYEQAGHRFVIRVPIARLAGLGKARSTRSIRDGDEEGLRACYARFAPRFNGSLDRGGYIWSRIRKLRETTYHGFCIDAGDRIAGYLYLAQVRDASNGRHEVHLSDLVFDDADIGRQLLAFLADFETMGTDVVFYGGPLHPAQTLLPQQRYRVELKDYWMLRVTDLRAALEARGYALGVDAHLGLVVRDEIVPANAGEWTLRVQEGSGRLSRGIAPGVARISCDIRGLAAMYSGLYAGADGELAGLLTGDARALSIARAVFAGGTPSMVDMF